MSDYRGIIFDLDGTLLSSLEDIADCANLALEQMGFPAQPLEKYRYFVGDGVALLIQRILPEEVRGDEKIRAELLARYSREYGENEGWAQKTAPYPGIPELLDAIDRKGVKKAVFSNKPANCTELCVSRLLSPWTFDEVVGQKDGVIPKKPDPAGARIILERWKMSPEEVLYVGDTSTDMKTAQNAGLFSIGVTWGFRPEEELAANGAKRIVHHPMEIAELF